MPPAYENHTAALGAQLRMLITTTDPLRWRLAFVQASSQIAMQYGLCAARPEPALDNASIVVVCARAALQGAPPHSWVHAFCGAVDA